MSRGGKIDTIMPAVHHLGTGYVFFGPTNDVAALDVERDNRVA
jgi:ATP-dependent Clp protease adapter protein ClpS